MISNAPDEILKDLKVQLGPLGYGLYNDGAPDDVDYPYLTIDNDNSDSDGNATEVFRLDIDGWDNIELTNKSTARLETMMSEMVKALQQKLAVANDKLSFRYILDQRMNITDPDISIKRRKYTFEVRAIGKE